jgi:arginine/ornithine transport system permease protein
MELSIIFDNIGIFIKGLYVTIQLTSVSLLIGLLIALPLAIARTSKNFLISGPIRFYVYIFRGTPLLIQMYIIYYGIGQFEYIRTTFLWDFFEEAWFCALFAFALNTGAYTTEIFRGAIEAMPFGEIEAAKCSGMSRFLMLRRIIIPSSIRRAVPAYANEVIFMLHGTALASVITIVDLTGAARMINSRYYSPWEAFLTAAVFYLVVTFAILGIFKKIEKRIYAHLVRV